MKIAQTLQKLVRSCRTRKSCLTCSITLSILISTVTGRNDRFSWPDKSKDVDVTVNRSALLITRWCRRSHFSMIHVGCYNWSAFWCGACYFNKHVRGLYECLQCDIIIGYVLAEFDTFVTRREEDWGTLPRKVFDYQ